MGGVVGLDGLQWGMKKSMKIDDPLAVLGQRIREARKAAGLTQQDVGRLLSVAKQTVSQWEVGASPPMITNLVKFCQIVDIDMARLFSDLSVDGASVQVERRLAASASLVPLYGQETAGRILMQELARREAEPKRYVASRGAVSSDALAITIDGRANVPKLREGDTIIIDPTVKAEPGQFVYAWAGGNFVVRRYYPRSVEYAQPGDILKPANGDFPQIQMSEGDQILGVMVEHTTSHHD